MDTLYRSAGLLGLLPDQNNSRLFTMFEVSFVMGHINIGVEDIQLLIYELADTNIPSYSFAQCF